MSVIFIYRSLGVFLFISLLASIVICVAADCARPPFELMRSRLGIDYGPRLIGVAASLGHNTKALCTIQNCGNLTTISSQIIALAKRNSVSEVLVGLPLDSNGKMSESVKNLNGRLCLNFSSVLAAILSEDIPKVKVLMVDERYTTREAKARMKIDGSRSASSLDAVSAQCLLERYLEDEGERSLAPVPCSYPIPRDIEILDYQLVREYVKDQYYREPDIEEKRRGYMQSMKEGRSGRSGGRRGGSR